MTGRPSVALTLGALGDFVLTLPLLRALQERGPLALWTRGGYRALLPAALQGIPFVDIEGPAGALLFAPGAPVPRGLAGALQGADAHLFMAPDQGFGDRLRRAGARRLVWHPPRPASPPHIVERFFVEAGIEPPAALLETPVMPRPATVRAGALWLHPGSGSPAKNIPLAELVRLARQEGAGAGRPLIVSFGEADMALQGPVRQAFAAHGLDCEAVVCPSLGELRRRLEADAAAFIGPDTGVTHLAAALGIPVTAVFRATDPAVWRPVGTVRVVRLP